MSTSIEDLYILYRRAILTRNDKEALRVIDAIVNADANADPPDPYANDERDRLRRKLLRLTLRRFECAFRASNPEECHQVLGEIEANDWPPDIFNSLGQPYSGIWKMALDLRCRLLLAKAAAHQAKDDWRGAQGLLGQIEQLQQRHRLTLSVESQQRLEKLMQWAAQRQEFDGALARFNELTQVLQQKHGLSHRSLHELAEMGEELSSLRSVLDRSTVPYADTLAKEHAACIKLLHDREHWLVGATRRKALMGLAALLPLCGLLAWAAVVLLKASSQAQKLNSARSNRQVQTAESQLAGLHGSRSPLLQMPPLKTAIRRAEAFVRQERALFTNCAQVLTSLSNVVAQLPDDNQTRILTASAIASLQQQFNTAQVAVDKLAPEYKSSVAARMEAYGTRWRACLKNCTREVNDVVARLLEDAESRLRALGFNTPPEPLKVKLDELQRSFAQLEAQLSSFHNNIEIQPELLGRFDASKRTLAAFQSESDRYHAATKKLAEARTHGEFAEVVTELKQLKFTAAPRVQAAMNIASLELDPDRVLGSLLFPQQPAAWDYVKNLRAGGSGGDLFRPRQIPKAVHDAWTALRDDPALGTNLVLHRLHAKQNAAVVMDYIVPGMLNAKGIWTNKPAYLRAASSTRFKLEPIDYFRYPNSREIRLSTVIEASGEKQMADYVLGDEVECTEARCFQGARLHEFLSTSDGSPRTPLLKVLDDLIRQPGGSPLAKAYLYSWIFQQMQSQPYEWGLAFTPAIAKHRTQLQFILNSELDSGDWFVPEKEARYKFSLDRLFKEMQSCSYLKQAQGLYALAVVTSAAGFAYAGYVENDGRAVIVPGVPVTELWGYAARSLAPAMLLAQREGNLVSIEPGLPLSPLFALAESRARLLSKALIQPADVHFAGYLPPFFSSVSAAGSAAK